MSCRSGSVRYRHVRDIGISGLTVGIGSADTIGHLLTFLHAGIRVLGYTRTELNDSLPASTPATSFKATLHEYFR
jgi:hypothetical protein